jgi:hypothetical protein
MRRGHKFCSEKDIDNMLREVGIEEREVKKGESLGPESDQV